MIDRPRHAFGRGWPAFALALLLAAAAPLRADDAFAAFVAEAAREREFSGTILVRRPGRPDHVASFGLAERSFGIANTPQTRYRIASITKAFTAVLILQLHEQGRLSLDATLGTYLPDYAGPARDRVTVHQLLNHTSGLANFDQVTSLEAALRDGVPNYQLPHDSDALLRNFCSGPLLHAPGSRFDYNNADYIILGKIVERLHGRGFDQVLRERILQPLALRDTGMLYQADVLPALARTYMHREDRKALAPDLPVYPENWYAAGAMYGTVADVAAFADGLFGGRLLRPESLARMLEPGLDDYGYGLWVYDAEIDGQTRRVAKRPGRIMGAQAQLFRVLDSGVTVVILANTDSVDLDAFVAEIGARAGGG